MGVIIFVLTVAITLYGVLAHIHVNGDDND